jgi:predicted TIM-barrel fold metal-dependent hydrolase
MLHAGNRTQDIIERTLEWCPPARLVYGSDGIGVPETHALGVTDERTNCRVGEDVYVPMQSE